MTEVETYIEHHSESHVVQLFLLVQAIRQIVVRRQGFPQLDEAA